LLFLRSLLSAFILLVVAVISAFAQDADYSGSDYTISGNPLTVHSIQFTGNKTFDNGTLGLLLQTQTPGFFYQFFPPYRWFANAPVLHPITIAQDSLALWNFYRQNGFFFAKVSPKINIDTAHVSADITFAIAESTACIVDTVIFSDLEKLSSADRQTITGIVAPLRGIRYSRATLSDSLSSVWSHLRNSGYPYARLSGSPRTVLNSDIRSVNIFIPDVIGEKYYFGNVDVQYDSSSGDVCFAENAVLRELEFKVGDIFSEEKRTRSEENLKRLGIFEVVRIELRVKQADSAHVAPVLVHLKLRKPFDVSPYFPTFDNKDGSFNFGASFTAAYHNVGCAGQELSLSSSFEIPVAEPPLTLSNNIFNIEAKFLQPRLQLGDILDYKNTSGQLSAGFTHATYPATHLTQNIWNASTLLSIRTATYTYFTPKIAFIVAQTYNLSQAELDSLLPTNPQLLQKLPNLLLSASLTRDNTNNLFVPSEGSSGTLTLKVNVLPTPYFFKVDATQKWFIPWGTQSVFGFRIHGGDIARFGGNRTTDNIIFDEQFYDGGAYSMRGWNLYALGIGIDSNIVFGRTGYSTFEANVEWRYRWFILPDSWINRVLLNRLSHDFFIDIGNIWSERQKWAWVLQMPQQLGVDAGFGLRYDTPVGPLRVDFGYIVYNPYTQSIQPIRFLHPTVQIGIGNAF